MQRRHTLMLGLGAIGAALLPTASLAQDAGQILNAVNTRLSAIRTLEASFVQLNADGSQSKGVLNMHRPGRMRMEYEGVNAPLILVGAGQIAVYDGARSRSPQVYPLERTPLWLVLRPDVNLQSGRGVRRAWAEGDHYYVHTFDPNTPTAGQVTFQFSKSPLMLQGWVSESQSGEKITVALLNAREGVSQPDTIFSPSVENSRRERR